MTDTASLPTALTQSHCPDLKLVARGKVRDIYEVPGKDDQLLFVATDRVSAFDVIMKNGIPYKGQLLTSLSSFWFNLLRDIVPNHLISTSLPPEVERYADQLAGRSMVVRKCEVIKCEAIVRGYLTGSAYSEYLAKGTVHGIPLPPGLKESVKLPEPLFTPSTKADVGQKDENIHPDRLPSLLSDPSLAPLITSTAIALYNKAYQHSLSRGLILADTKFEFGLLPSTSSSSKPTLLLIDEALTPDSSRFWKASEWEEGKRMSGVDKQFLRDWLKGDGGFGKDGAKEEAVEIPEGVVRATLGRYEEAFEALTGEKFEPLVVGK